MNEIKLIEEIEYAIHNTKYDELLYKIELKLKKMFYKYTTEDAFLEDTIKCFVWIPIAESEKEEELQIQRLPMQELEWLLRDIPGEAG